MLSFQSTGIVLCLDVVQLLSILYSGHPSHLILSHVSKVLLTMLFSCKPAHLCAEY